MDMYVEHAAANARLARAVIIRAHGGQLKAVLREQLNGSRGQTHPAPFYLDVLNRAERELVTVAPLQRQQDLEGHTVTEGFVFDLAHYQAAFIAMVLRRKRRLYRSLAPAHISAERFKEVKLEVFLENSSSVEAGFSDLSAGIKRIDRLNKLEPEILALIELGLNKLSKDIRDIERMTAALEHDLAVLEQQLAYRPGLFARKPDPGIRAHLLGRRTDIVRTLECYRQSKKGLSLHLQTKAAEKGIKRLAVLEFIAEFKLRALGIPKELLALGRV
jgi:hypothetical protein